MPRLTIRFVNNLKASDKDQFIFDTALKGFGIKVAKGGTKSYIVQYRNIDGRKRRYTIGRHNSPWKTEAARQEAEKILASVALGGDPAECRSQKRQDLTIKELSVLYWNDITEGIIITRHGAPKKISTLGTDKGRINRHIIPLLGHRKINSLTSSDMVKFQADIANGKTATTERTGPHGLARVTGGKGTASRTLNLLSSMISYAIEKGFMAKNPCIGVKRFKDNKHMRNLSRVEIQNLGKVLDEAVLEGKNPKAISILKLLLLTGARKTEIESLEWSFIDWERGLLGLPDSKTGQKVIYVSEDVLQILREQAQAKNSKYVFPASTGQGYYVGTPKVWRILRKQLELEDVRIHDLRHAFASWAVTDGTGLYVVSKMLGHSQQTTTQRYAHLADHPIKLATDRTSRALSDALSGKTSDSVITL